MPLYNHIMMPTHQYNRRTLLMMQNLHNSYLYNAATGILFSRRGYNSEVSKQMNKADIGSLPGDLSKDDLRLGALGERVINCTQDSIPMKMSHKDSEPMGNSITGEPINIH